MAGLTVLTIIAIFSWFGIKKALAQSRIDELLPEFVQVTDKFTRPKVFIHKSFIDIPGEGQPRHFACRLMAYSDGRIKAPILNKEKDAFRVAVNINDRIFEFNCPSFNNEFSSFVDFATGLAGNEDIDLDIRITDVYNSNNRITPGDYTIKGSELAAFMKTLELTHLFKTISE